MIKTWNNQNPPKEKNCPRGITITFGKTREEDGGGRGKKTLLLFQKREGEEPTHAFQAVEKFPHGGDGLFKTRRLERGKK